MKSRRGRPSAYKPEYARMAGQLCLLGHIDAEIAAVLDVSEATLNTWKQKHPEFLESLKRGKLIADAEVAHSLYQRATGYEWVEQQSFKTRRIEYRDGKRVAEYDEVVTVPMKRFMLPDVTACIFWLKNRQPKLWRDKQDHELSGPAGRVVTVDMIDSWVAEDDAEGKIQ